MQKVRIWGHAFRKLFVHQNSMSIPVQAFRISISKVHDETNVLLKGKSTRNKKSKSFTRGHLLFLLLEKKIKF